MYEDGYACQICGARRLQEVPGFSGLPRVTSDCKPYGAGGRLSVCGGCGAAQKLLSEAWLRDTRSIYAAYQSYFQAGGVEQSVFDRSSRSIRPRSEILVDRLAQRLELAAEGRILDVGCGAGGMLGAFSRTFPGWRLSGQDLDERELPRLRTLARFEQLHTCALDALPGRYDLITLVHSLEHIPEPVNALKSLATKLRPGGCILIQVPDSRVWPFDLLVADHLCHFEQASLAALVRRAGLEPTSGDWIQKEISLVAVRGSGASPVEAPIVDASPGQRLDRVGAQLRWLHRFLERCSSARPVGPFGLFGTSVSATWVFGSVKERVSFFVDEDPARIGGMFMGHPIYAPADAPEGAEVFLALIPEVAQLVLARLRSLPLKFILPPDAEPGSW
ncbi:MAG: class I SAM-dependent methyltransferase [Myxococcota bacterium]